MDVLVGMLRKLGGDQVISGATTTAAVSLSQNRDRLADAAGLCAVLVQYFSMESPALKNEVMPRGMAGGPRRWFQEHAEIFSVGNPDRDGQTRVGLQSHLLNKPGCD